MIGAAPDEVKKKKVMPVHEFQTIYRAVFKVT